MMNTRDEGKAVLKTLHSPAWRDSRASQTRRTLAKRLDCGVFSAAFMIAVCIAISSTFSTVAHAQPLAPHIGYVYPAGGRQGTTFQVLVGGQYLAGVSNAFVSGTGVRATVIEYNRPLSQKEFTDLRDEFRTLQEKRRSTIQTVRRGGPAEVPASTNVWTAADEKRIAEIRARILKNPPNRQGNPAIAESITLQITVAPDAGPEEREIRLGTPVALSNPLLFCVDQLPEISKPAAKILPDLNVLRQLMGPNATALASNKTEIRVTMPAVINGQIMPGAVDRFHFSARGGQKLVAAVSARRLIPYLADAVPGWFQATLAVYDAKGREVAYNDDFRFSPDPVLCCEIPADGEYVLEIKDSIFRGREDFVYRITLGELPFITGIFPMGGAAGKSTGVELTGWNLSETSLTFDAAGRGPGIYPVTFTKDGRISNPMAFAVDALDEGVEREPNSLVPEASPLTLPIIVNGRIHSAGDWDVFRFSGRAGDEVVAEVVARRLGSPLDSVLKLTDSAGRQLAFNDDHEDKGTGLNTHHADSYLRAVLPSDGAYFVHIGDVQHQGGAEYGYRLRISAPEPDFALRVTPSSLSLRPGISAPVIVYALRKDGFTNEIQLALVDAPTGVTLSGARIPANQDQVRVTICAPATAQREPMSLNLEGRATCKEREIVHRAVPADDEMQAFAYRHLVPAKEWKVAVADRALARIPSTLRGAAPVSIPRGGTGNLRIPTPTAFADRFELQLNEPPEGITLEKILPGRDGMELVFRGDATKAASGLEGNLIVNVYPAAGSNAARGRPQANRQRQPVGTLPAIPFRVSAP